MLETHKGRVASIPTAQDEGAAMVNEPVVYVAGVNSGNPLREAKQ